MTTDDAITSRPSCGMALGLPLQRPGYPSQYPRAVRERAVRYEPRRGAHADRPELAKVIRRLEACCW